VTISRNLSSIPNTITANTIIDSTGNTVPIATVVKGAAKAWGSYAFVGVGSTPTLRGAFNISSITRNSTGNFTLAFTTAMPNVNYSFSGSATYTTGNEPSFCNAITKTTANVTMVNGYIGSNSLWAVYDYGLDFVIFN
jgi:hypothetical protein